MRQERPNWSGPIASVIRASRRRSRVRDLLAYKIAAFGSGERLEPPTLVLFFSDQSKYSPSDRADFPICSPQYPNLRRARSRPVPMGLCAVSRWRDGADTKAKRDLSSALDRISEQITTDLQPKGPFGEVDSKKTNYIYISIRYGGERVSQSPLKDQAFSTFLDQNPPFELLPENGISPSTKSLSRPMARHRQQCDQATIAKGKLPSHRSA
jgi:hypothetical protein